MTDSIEILDLIEMAEQSSDPQEIETGKKARKELAALRAERSALRESATKALRMLRSTKANWNEQCLFDCNDILADALGVEK